jgi:hypothetical protein
MNVIDNVCDVCTSYLTIRSELSQGVIAFDPRIYFIILYITLSNNKFEVRW